MPLMVDDEAVLAVMVEVVSPSSSPQPTAATTTAPRPSSAAAAVRAAREVDCTRGAPQWSQLPWLIRVISEQELHATIFAMQRNYHQPEPMPSKTLKAGHAAHAAQQAPAFDTKISGLSAQHLRTPDGTA